MKVDENLLMAYVDGELPRQQHPEVEALVAGSTAAAEFVTALRASQVDYRAAFAEQKLPPVPASLTQSIDALIREHCTGRMAANAARAAPDSQRMVAPVRSRWRALPGWLAAGCVAGAFCAGLMLRTGPFVGTRAAGTNGMSPWATAAVAYQRLYSRDTVARAQVDTKYSASVIDDIRAKDHLDLHVPDLSRAGLQFKAVQRLNFNNRPLVQIVYLPQKGLPIALCVIREPKPDAGVTVRTVDSMHVITWRQAQLGYALIGKTDGVDLEALGRLIAEHGTDQLFGAAAGSVAVSPDA
jgi:anti-sigma factor RsiW